MIMPLTKNVAGDTIEFHPRSSDYLFPIMGGNFARSEKERVPVARFFDTSLKQLFKEFNPLLYVFLAGVVLSYPSARIPWEWIREIVMDLGHALIVASVLAFMVDAWAKDRLLRDAAADISHHLLGWGLPPELQGHIREVVQKTDIIREDTTVSYRLTPLNDGNVTVDVDWFYKVRNHSAADAPYTPEMAIEGLHQPRLISFDCHPQKGMPYKLDKDTIGTTEDPESHVRRFRGRESIIQPHSLQDAACLVFWRYQMTMPENYSDIIAFSGATLNVTIKCDIPDDFVFVATPKGNTENVPDTRVWYYARPFLPGQHIRVWWYPKTSR
jgi:hypothetical protein